MRRWACFGGLELQRGEKPESSPLPAAALPAAFVPLLALHSQPPCPRPPCPAPPRPAPRHTAPHRPTGDCDVRLLQEAHLLQHRVPLRSLCSAWVCARVCQGPGGGRAGVGEAPPVSSSFCLQPAQEKGYGWFAWLCPGPARPLALAKRLCCCPARPALHQAARPCAILDLIRSGEQFRIRAGGGAGSGVSPQRPGSCVRCGYLSSQVRAASCRVWLAVGSERLPALGGAPFPFP